MVRKSIFLLLLFGVLPFGPVSGQSGEDPAATDARIGRLIQEGRHAEAISEARAFCDRTAKRYGDQDPRFAQTLHVLARTYGLSGDTTRAIDNWRRSLAILGRQRPENLRAVLLVAGSLAEGYRRADRRADALTCSERVLKIATRVPAREGRPWIARMEFIRGVVFAREGDRDRAEKAYRRAAGIYDEDVGRNSPGFRKCLAALERLHRSEARPATLSEQQKSLVGEFGYPDTFTLTFSESGEERVRLEVWHYHDLRTWFRFINGAFAASDETEAMPEDCLFPDYRPEAFRAGMSLEEVNAVLGPRKGAALAMRELGLESPFLDEVTVYASQQVFFGFTDGGLHAVMTVPAKPADGGEGVPK